MGSSASSCSSVNLLTIAKLRKPCEKRASQSQEDQRISLTVISGKGIGKSAHLNSGQMWEGRFCVW